MPAVVVTNFNANFTGVSATAAAVMRQLSDRVPMRLCGVSLPGCPRPVGIRRAWRFSREEARARGRVTVWHVRRNSEMLAAIVLRDLFRLPIKTVFTSAAQRRHSAFPRWLIARMDAVIATSDAAAGLVPNVVAVAPHGVDTGRFRPVEDRTAAWRDLGFGGGRGVATVGRIRPEKGTDRFVDAMTALLPSRPDVVALVIGRASHGDAQFERNLKDRVARAKLSDRILFPGEVSPARLAEILPALSLLVAPPRYEGYGMTVLEAMASGTPVVATDTGHFSAFIGEGEAGILVENVDGPALADAAATLLDDDERQAAAGLAARRRAVELFALEGEAAAIADIYCRVSEPL